MTDQSPQCLHCKKRRGLHEALTLACPYQDGFSRHRMFEPAPPEPETKALTDMDELVSGVPQNVSPKEVGVARAAKSVRTESEKKSVKQELPVDWKAAPFDIHEKFIEFPHVVALIPRLDPEQLDALVDVLPGYEHLKAVIKARDAAIKERDEFSARLAKATDACLGCGGKNCSALWINSRKCCPDCSHKKSEEVSLNERLHALVAQNLALIKERDNLAAVVGQAILLTSLSPHEDLGAPLEHALIDAVYELSAERNAAIKRAEEAEEIIEKVREKLAELRGPR